MRPFFLLCWRLELGSYPSSPSPRKRRQPSVGAPTSTSCTLCPLMQHPKSHWAPSSSSSRWTATQRSAALVFIICSPRHAGHRGRHAGRVIVIVAGDFAAKRARHLKSALCVGTTTSNRRVFVILGSCMSLAADSGPSRPTSIKVCELAYHFQQPSRFKIWHLGVLRQLLLRRRLGQCVRCVRYACIYSAAAAQKPKTSQSAH